MNKSELIEAVATSADIDKANAGRAVNAVFSSIQDVLSKGGTLSLAGFGTFSVAERAARQGRNPRTGEPIQIEAAKLPKFKAGKGLKEAVK